ncbi:MAG: 30S ribosomal protein S20 [Alphaproteobacteria bacterium]|jgi:small subunit ribosomal protein S20
MANSPQARKRVRQEVRRTEVNRARVSQYRTFVKKVEVALATGDKAIAQAALREAQPVLMSAVNKNIAHKNTVARKISRLNRRVKLLA